MDAGLVAGVDHLAIDVELELRRGRVADAYGPRAAETGQPIELALFEASLARDAIHDLHVGGIARHRPQHPLSPGLRLVEVAGVQHCDQRHAGVPQPAEAIVPVAHTADPFG